MSPPIVVRMKMREAKVHSVRYDAVASKADEPALTGIYVMKSSLPRPYPEFITVTIDVGGDK